MVATPEALPFTLVIQDLCRGRQKMKQYCLQNIQNSNCMVVSFMICFKQNNLLLSNHLKYIRSTRIKCFNSWLINFDVTESNITSEYLSESYYVNKLDGNTLPLTYQMIDEYQQKYKNW